MRFLTTIFGNLFLPITFKCSQYNFSHSKKMFIIILVYGQKKNQRKESVYEIIYYYKYILPWK